jgi:ketosteroid isomerase-like protein
VELPTETAASSHLRATIERLLETKTSRDLEGTMSYFAPDMVGYIDATLGWDLAGHGALRAVFENCMPDWGPAARSYATEILAGTDSALVHMVDTPELFGEELRILAAVDFVDGRVVRWVDYWDSSAYDTGLYDQFRARTDRTPAELRRTRVPSRADSRIATVATALQRALGAGDASAVASAMHPDVVLVDMALRTQVLGRVDVGRYLERVLATVPYGRGSTLRRVVGGPRGGGFEWTAGAEAGRLAGISALELDPTGHVTRLTSVYDSRQIAPLTRSALVEASLPGPPSRRSDSGLEMRWVVPD